jgi:hypothetical protein
MTWDFAAAQRTISLIPPCHGSEIPPAGQDDMALHCGTLTQHLTDSAMPWQRGCSTTRHRQPGNALS